MRRLDLVLDRLVAGSTERLHGKAGGIADVACCVSVSLTMRDKGQHAHFVCPGCGLDMPADMVVDMREVQQVSHDWLCTGCLDGLYRQGRKPDGSRYTRKEVYEMAGATVSANSDFWDRPPQLKATRVKLA